MWLTGLVAPRHVGSSQTRARTRVPCIGRQTLNHCATREAPGGTFLTHRWSRWAVDLIMRLRAAGSPLLAITHRISPSAASRLGSLRDTELTRDAPYLEGPQRPSYTIDRQGRVLSQNMVDAKPHGNTKETTIQNDGGIWKDSRRCCHQGEHLKESRNLNRQRNGWKWPLARCIWGSVRW